MSTALVLDIDGTVLPHTAFSPFGDLVDVGPGLRPMLVSRQLCRILDRLGALPGVYPAWLTGTIPARRRQLSQPFPGRTWDQVPPAPSLSHQLAWPKWAALTAWLDVHQDVTRLAWIDDDLGLSTTVPQNSREQLSTYHSELADHLDDVLLIAPPPECGITPAQLELLSGWVTAPPT